MKNTAEPIESYDLNTDLLRMLANQVKLSPLPVIMSMSLIAIMASDKVEPRIWGSWLSVVALLQGLRWYIYRTLPEVSALSTDTRLLIATTINIMNTAAHIASLFFFPVFSPFERAIQSMLIVGMGVVSVMTTAGYRPFTLTHILIGLVPMYSMWIWSAVLAPFNWIEITIPAIGLVYAITLYAISNQIYQLYQELYNKRRELQVALNAAEAAGRAKTRFLAAASHDLRQPIHTLSLFSASLNIRPLDTGSKEIIKHIDNAIRALTYQLDGILDISKLDAGAVEVSRETL